MIHWWWGIVMGLYCTIWLSLDLWYARELKKLAKREREREAAAKTAEEERRRRIAEVRTRKPLIGKTETYPDQTRYGHWWSGKCSLPGKALHDSG